MQQLQEIIVILIVIIVLGYYYDKLFGLSVSLTEGFLGQTQNFVMTNKNNIANQLEYGSKDMVGMYHNLVLMKIQELISLIVEALNGQKMPKIPKLMN